MSELLRQMTVGRKFLLIAIASLVPLAFSTALWLEEIHGRVTKLESERAGLVVHRELRKVLAVLADGREVAVRSAAEEGRRPAATAALREAEKMFASIEPQATRRGKDEEAKKFASAFKAYVDGGARAVAAGNAQDAWMEHGEAMGRLVALMGHVASTSGLVVDDDPPTYYLARIGVERTPLLVSRLSEASALGPVIAARGKATDAEVNRLRTIAVLGQADLQAIGASAADLVRVDAELAGRANQPLPEASSAARTFFRGVESLSLVAKDGISGWDWLYESDARLKVLQSYDRVHHELGTVLQARVDDLLARRNILIAVNLGVVGIAALFAFILMRSVRSAIGRALVVADRVAGGDLTVAPDARGHDETARLMRALKAMTQGLARMVGEVNAASNTIGSNVRMVAQGNRELSERTEAQGSAIEEAAASVRQNKDAARDTRRIAELAGAATTRGIEAASRVVDHMESIRAGTQRVGEIVGMIDSIAFQTNILALNAAVEAARAGEHGRGFAVVAAEVRNLSRRCADSAREIKGLIGTASEQVTDGAKLVDEVAEAIGDINTHVVQVGELMNRVVAASSEQASGIDQVSQMITQMEGATQQNAALVEEIVAATDSLAQQTERLGTLVGAFRLESAPRAPMPPIAPAPDRKVAPAGTLRAPSRARARRLPQT